MILVDTFEFEGQVVNCPPFFKEKNFNYGNLR